MIHQQYRGNIAGIELYVDFKTVALALEPKSSTFPNRDAQWEECNSESDEEEFEDEYGSDDKGALDDVDDDANDEQGKSVSNRRAIFHVPFRSSSYACIRISRVCKHGYVAQILKS